LQFSANPANPRSAVVQKLSAHLGRLVAARDAITKLLGAEGAAAGVLDIGLERSKQPKIFPR